jgi:hypothetical protein
MHPNSINKEENERSNMKAILVLFIISQILFPQINSKQKSVIIKKDSTNISSFSNKHLADTKESSNHIIIDNWQEKDSFWSQFFSILIPTLLVAFLTWILTYLPQKNQNFRNMFFDLLNQQSEILNRISVEVIKSSKQYKYEGVHFFKYFNQTLHKLYDFISQEIEEPERLENETLNLSDSAMSKNELREFYNNRYKTKRKISDLEHELFTSLYIYNFLFDKHADSIRNYFRHLYHIYHYLDSSKLIFGKKKLADLIQARMTDSELLVLFYNGLKYQRMQEYIIKFDIIENLYIEDLLDPFHQRFYHLEMKSRKEKVELSPEGKKRRKELETEFKKLTRKIESNPKLIKKFGKGMEGEKQN